MSYYVTFEKKQSARTGNILFQYLFAKSISIRFGHTYIPIEEIPSRENTLVIYDSNSGELWSGEIDPSNRNIILDGFFQRSEYYVYNRGRILDSLYSTDDYWIGCSGKKEYMRDFLTFTHKYLFHPNDVVISLRLDDFIQLPCPTSDIIPPQYYLNVLENWVDQKSTTPTFGNLYIVCDRIRHDWERKYLDFFQKWSPILIQDTLQHDCAVMRDCPNLLHSNSTLCWFMSFVSKSKISRFIPKTGFYGGQNLCKIEYPDILTTISPLSHHDVYNLHSHPFFKSCIYPLSYCIPDECIVDSVPNKTDHIAELVPGNMNTYKYSSSQETEYNQMYQRARFAYTMKKGGWDCMRHYEIMANGCIPIFKGLDQCPPLTLTTFPKQLIQQAETRCIDWRPEHQSEYTYYANKMLRHVRENCSTTATTQYFLEKMGNIKPHNVLLIMGNCGVNYTRETFWIGMKRYIQSQGGVAVEYPKIDFLYENYSGEKSRLYGNGFTYAYRLKDDYNFTEEDLAEKIKSKFFDLIIYGKVGPDEGHEGHLSHMAFWPDVFKRYNKNQIVFLYGGDECIDLTTNNRYSQHILYHSQFGHCFVREFRI